MQRSFLLFFLSLGFLFFSCKRQNDREVTHSFYFWRTIFNMQEEEQADLRKQGVTRLYVRLFDVAYEPVAKAAVPEGDIRFETLVDTGLHVVPMVYITNEALLQTSDSLMEQLSIRIASRIRQSMGAVKGQIPEEIQTDCDWTESTRIRYFRLLTFLRQSFGPSITLSATIRLHQVKYADRTGVPPVDRGMLMFYNMGKLELEQGPNSIYDKQTASAYLVNFSSYPLALDVALPVFSWAVVFRDGKVAALVHQVEAGDMNIPGLEALDKTHYRVTASVKLKNIELQAGETIRLEDPGTTGCLEAASQISPFLKAKKFSVALFHLKKNKYNDYEKQDFEKVFHCFN